MTQVALLGPQPPSPKLALATLFTTPCRFLLPTTSPLSTEPHTPDLGVGGYEMACGHCRRPQEKALTHNSYRYALTSSWRTKSVSHQIYRPATVVPSCLMATRTAQERAQIQLSMPGAAARPRLSRGRSTHKISGNTYTTHKVHCRGTSQGHTHANSPLSRHVSPGDSARDGTARHPPNNLSTPSRAGPSSSIPQFISTHFAARQTGGSGRRSRQLSPGPPIPDARGKAQSSARRKPTTKSRRSSAPGCQRHGANNRRS